MHDTMSSTLAPIAFFAMLLSPVVFFSWLEWQYRRPSSGYRQSLHYAKVAGTVRTRADKRRFKRALKGPPQVSSVYTIPGGMGEIKRDPQSIYRERCDHCHAHQALENSRCEWCGHNRFTIVRIDYPASMY